MIPEHTVATTLRCSVLKQPFGEEDPIRFVNTGIGLARSPAEARMGRPQGQVRPVASVAKPAPALGDTDGG
jgi:hypothetical protein